MELKHLASFVSVAEQLSFVRAAHTLHISQSALTAQIQKSILAFSYLFGIGGQLNSAMQAQCSS
jgi:hypothetical protein